MRNEAIAVCRGVGKIYPTTTGDIHALIGVDASFPAAALTALVGPSGSGKSSLLRILAALDRPSEGSVEVGEEWVSEMGARARRRVRRRSLRYVFQRPSDNLISYLTVMGHMKLAAEITHSDKTQLDEILERLGIAHRKDNRPDELSGGEQQRLAFAQAIVGDPLLVVADEPTAELDAASTHSTIELMRALAEEGTCLVVATHDPAVAHAASQTIELMRGRRA